MLLLMSAAAFRIWGAWAFRYLTDPDSSVVALMASHMVEGHPPPVFFYGQSYMGSLEPMVSAVFVFLLGPTGFAVGLGSALVAMLALGVGYLLARDVGDKDTALASLSLCVVGPASYFIFQFTPRGGYMVALLADAFLLWYASRLSVLLWQGARPSLISFFWLGLVAGLALWSHLITLSAVLASAGVLLIGIKGKCWRVPTVIVAGLLGAALGFSPWILYNIGHHGSSMEMKQFLSFSNLPEGLHYLRLRWVQLLGLEGYSHKLGSAVGWGYLLLAFIGGGSACREFIKTPVWSRQTAARLACLLFLLFSLVLFACSQFAQLNAPRYLIPIYPVLAVFCGLGFWVLLQQRRSKWLGWGWLLLLLCSQFNGPAAVWKNARRIPDMFAGHERIVTALRENNIHNLYAAWNYYYLNFMTHEAFTFADSEKVFYEPHSERLEFAKSPAVFKNYGGVDAFLDVTGGSAKVASFDGGEIHHHFAPPPEDWRPVDKKEWSVVQMNQQDAALLTDVDISTGYSCAPGQSSSVLQVDFADPLSRGRVRLQFSPPKPGDDWHLPETFQVEIRKNQDPNWVPFIAKQGITQYFWSGARFYHAGRRFRMEFHLPEENITGFRIHLGPRSEPRSSADWKLVELELFATEGDSPISWAEALSSLQSSLRAENVRRLYADQWVSNQLYKTFDAPLDLELSAELSLDGGLPKDGSVQLVEDTAFLVRNGEAPACLRILSELTVAHREQQIGPWTLILCETQSSTRPLYWTGYGLCLRGTSRDNSLGASPP